MLTLIENGYVFTPQPIGRASVLLAGGIIQHVGNVDAQGLGVLGVPMEVINADHCIVLPGFIDPHEHLLGGSGEKGFSSQTPEIYPSELVAAGITTVVGCLGVDTTTKTMAGLLAKAKGLKEEGLNAFIWSGGYNVPPTTLTNSIRTDILFIEEVIGAGEVAIADERSADPNPQELARIVDDAYVGGLLSRKAGLTHFHVGEHPACLKVLWQLLYQYQVVPQCLYPTHVERNESLMEEAAQLSRRGCFVDVDVLEEDLSKWLRFFLDHEGDPKQLTVSTDAGIKSPAILLSQFRECIRDGHPLELVLSLVTSNTARALKLENKGQLKVEASADVLVLREETLELSEVIVGGRRLLKNGCLDFKEAFLKESSRAVSLVPARANQAELRDRCG
jgi:beta-aspartyl-dipeptidase (metallo-type)